MDCREFYNEAGSVLEGENLPEAQAHLAGCPRCQRFVEELGALGQAARALPLQQPSPELWTRLEKAALAEGLWERRSWWRSTRPFLSFFPVRPAYAATLAAILLAGVAALVYPFLFTPAVETTGAPYADAAKGEFVRQTAYGLRYEKHLQRVEERVLDDSTLVDAELRGLVARPLSTVDRCIKETRQRLAEYPEDSLAQAELHRLYRQKAALLHAMSDPHWMETAPQ